MGHTLVHLPTTDSGDMEIPASISVTVNWCTFWILDGCQAGVHAFINSDIRAQSKLCVIYREHHQRATDTTDIAGSLTVW
jgi:hypothetical protein